MLLLSTLKAHAHSAGLVDQSRAAPRTACARRLVCTLVPPPAVSALFGNHPLYLWMKLDSLAARRLLHR